MNAVTESYERDQCCPRNWPDKKNRPDLKYESSAYPEAIRCIQRVGCDDRVIFQQLVEECESICTTKIGMNNMNPCFAEFNGANRMNFSVIGMIVIFLSSLILLIEF